ncbi:hypothetical protein BZL29_0357 [Mycobacterium kansasii]|uniref:2-oxoadipate dioxygenase/decarboxylase n=1 Tax=Mycobacterium kansasii TaxID=1768 RepID=A0A1V3XX27_MYCKA|nr:hypothetical protein BZL29_0357 [Mycobacterium kansasii]
MIAADGGCDAAEAQVFVAGAVAAFALSREPIDKSWYDELSRVSAVAADIAGIGSTHINHLTPRVLDIDELYRRMSGRGIAMIDTIQGPPRTAGPAVLLRQTSFRALAEPRLFRCADGRITEGSLRVRFGEVEARGVALTPRGRERYDTAMAHADPAAVWGTTSRPRMRSWPRRVWPTTVAATRRHPSSTRTSCPPRRPESSAPIWTATAAIPVPPTRSTIAATTWSGWPGQSDAISTTPTHSMKHRPRRLPHDQHQRATRPGPGGFRRDRGNRRPGRAG